MPNVKKISKRNKTIVVLAITIIMVLLCYLVFNLISIQDSKKMQIKVLEITPYTETSSIVGQDVEKAYAVATINGKKYINKLNTVKLLLQGTDENYSGSSLTANNIVVKVGGNTITPTTKTLSSAQSITNGVQYELTISGITGNGELTVEVAADTLTDKSNNKNILTKFDSEIIVDNSAPTLSSIKVTSPVAGTYTTGENVTIVATFNESVKGSAPVLGLKFGNTASKGTVKAGTISGSTITYTYTITAGDNGVLGINTFSGTALTDMVGNIWSSTVLGNTGNAITADTTAPNTPTITAKTTDGNSYTSDNWTNQDVTITASSSDNISGVKQIEYSYDNSTWKTDWGTTMTTSGTTSTISGTWSSDYNTTIYVRAIDKLGNISGVSSIVLKIDKTAPSTTSVEIKNVTTTGYDVYVYGVTDSGSGVNRVQFPTWTEANGEDDIQSNWQTDSKSTGVKQSDGTTWVYHVNVADHNNEYGKYITHVYVCDNSGNNQYIKEETATVPAVNITYDNNYLENNLWTDTDDLAKYKNAGTSLSNKTRTHDTSVMHGYINEFTMNAGTSGGVYYVPSAKLTVGKTYTWSAYVKTSSSKTLKIGQEQNGQKTVNATTSWQKITHTYTAVDNTNGHYAFVFYVTGGSTWTEGDKLYVHSLEIKEGDSLDISTVQKGYGAALGTLNTPTRTGYTFAGWFTAPTGGTQISSTTTTPESDTTYYAHWTINSYNVTFNGDVISTSFDNETVVLDTTGTNVPVFKSSELSLETNTKYLLSFDYVIDTGSNTFDVDLYPDDLPQTKLTATTTKQHAEWKITSSASNMSNCYLRFFDDINPASDTGKITITNIILYKLESKQYMYNEKLGTLTTPTRTGYTFEGWYTAPTGGTQISSETRVPANDVSYYSQWKANTNTPYKIIHQQMGLDGKTYTTVDTENLTGTTDAKITPATKTYTGFTAPATQEVKIKCDGTTEVIYKYTRNQYKQIVQIRYENADGTYGEYTNEIDTNYYYGATVSWSRAADTTYQAASITSYTVTEAKTTQVDVLRNVFKFDLNGWLDGASSGNITGYGKADVTVNGVKIKSAITDCYVDVRYGSSYEITNIVVNSGYQYNGVHSGKISGTITGNTSVYLDFTIINYTITYNLDGGSVETENPTTYNVKTADITLNNPTKTGYLFAGWTGTDVTTPQTSVKISTGSTGNRTYTANWTAKTVNVTFYRNTSSSDTTTAKQTFTYGVSGQKFSEKGWTKTGYTLLGWSKSRTATTASYSVTSAVDNSWIDSNYPSVDVYAVWKINSYTITYNSNMQMSSYSGNNGFTITQGTEDAGSYYRATFTKTSGTANEWRYIKFPSYQFEEGATYTIHIKIRMQSVTNASGTAVRHSALSNDYWTTGRQSVGFESATVGEWKEYTLTRKFEKTYTNGSTTYNTAPLIEIYTGNLALSDTITSRSLTFDFKDVWVDKVTTTSKNYNEQLGTLPTDTRTGYNLNGWYTQRNRRKSN